jgi:alcohol dehydrogenase
MLGATHALANPLTANFNTTHGIAIGIMLPHVIKFNAEVMQNDYLTLAKAINVIGVSSPHTIDQLCEFITSLVSEAGCPTKLSQLEIDKSKIPVLALEATKQWTGSFNPRHAELEDYINLYKAAW